MPSFKEPPPGTPEALVSFLAAGGKKFRCDDGDWNVRLEEPPGFIAQAIPGPVLLIAHDGAGNFLFLKAGADGNFGSEVFAYWHDERPPSRSYCPDLRTLTDPAPATPSAVPVVYYHDGVTPVQLDDQVATRSLWSFFRLQTGRVVYVPGVSKKNRLWEHSGLCWVALRVKSGTTLGLVVDPQTSRLRPGVRFVGRNAGAA